MGKLPITPNHQPGKLEPGEDLEQLRLFAQRYQWLRERAVRVQGSEVWYSGKYLDLRVDIGLGHRRENELPDE